MIKHIQDLILNNKVVDAFWLLANRLNEGEDMQRLFLRLVGLNNNVSQLHEDINRIQALAEQGDPYMQYTFARIHDRLQILPNSTKIAEEYFTRAIEGGIADARVCRAYIYRDGDFGEADINRYQQELMQALAEGSERAKQQQIRDLTHGLCGTEPDPQQAFDFASQHVADECSDAPDPVYYHLMADACVQLGRIDDAVAYYEKAYQYGDSQSLFWFAYYSCSDEMGRIINREQFSELMEKGKNIDAPEAFMEYAMLITEEAYHKMSDENKEAVTKALSDDLQYGWLLGDGFCAGYLADFYENGRFGFKQDNFKAWIWYLRGAALRNPICYAALAEMILSRHNAPDDYTDEQAYEYAYRALMLGYDDILETVCEGYKQGHLQSHATAIENVYLPQYEAKMSESDDDFDDDFGDDDYEPEQEVGEDDWTMDPDIDTRMQSCHQCVEKAESLAREQDRPWKVTALIRRYVDMAKELSNYEHFNNELYSLNSRMLNLIYEHPRLKLELCKIQIDVLYGIEASSDHELGITEDLIHEKDALARNIYYADNGTFEKIVDQSHLKHDPVEWTEHWEEVIDEADRIAYAHLKDTPRGMGFCFAFWHERRRALKQFGISWRDPHMMNPRVMFD